MHIQCENRAKLLRGQRRVMGGFSERRVGDRQGLCVQHTVDMSLNTQTSEKPPFSLNEFCPDEKGWGHWEFVP